VSDICLVVINLEGFISVKSLQHSPEHSLLLIELLNIYGSQLSKDKLFICSRRTYQHPTIMFSFINLIILVSFTYILFHELHPKVIKNQIHKIWAIYLMSPYSLDSTNPRCRIEESWNYLFLKVMPAKSWIQNLCLWTCFKAESQNCTNSMRYMQTFCDFG
jgi:hypothetical protein